MTWGTSAWGVSEWGSVTYADPQPLTRTTTPELMRDQMKSVLEAIVPTSMSSQRFLQHKGYADFEEWCEANPNACFRRFHIQMEGMEPVDGSDHQIELREFRYLLTVAYPKELRSKYGADQANDLFDVMREDMHVIDKRIGLYGGALGNYASGQGPTIVDTDDPFQSGSAVIFLTLPIRAQYYRSV